MIQLSDLQDVIGRQESALKQTESYERGLLGEIAVPKKDFALIISGIRRCGKSTLVGQIIKREGRERSLFLNFDNMRLYGFEAEHFSLLDDILKTKPEVDTLCFDEIQAVRGWEVYVREKLDEGYRVVVIGSNASMLSRELGSKLTGRHLSKELFPFSFREYCGFRGEAASANALQGYLDNGGFPLYLKEPHPELLSSLVEDILYRDIAVRHHLRNETMLKRFAALLLGNAGNLISASRLKQPLGIGSSSTVLEYLSYFEQSYLFGLVPKFSYSQKSQLANPRKLYCVDNGILTHCSSSASRDDGRRLENFVYCELRRKTDQISYYNESGKECDFIVGDGKGGISAIQVCHRLDAGNRKREAGGLLDAMNFFGADNGLIITFDQRDKIVVGGKTINVLPAHEYFG